MGSPGQMRGGQSAHGGGGPIWIRSVYGRTPPPAVSCAGTALGVSASPMRTSANVSRKMRRACRMAHLSVRHRPPMVGGGALELTRSEVEQDNG